MAKYSIPAYQIALDIIGELATLHCDLPGDFPNYHMNCAEELDTLHRALSAAGTRGEQFEEVLNPALDTMGLLNVKSNVWKYTPGYTAAHFELFRTACVAIFG